MQRAHLQLVVVAALAALVALVAVALVALADGDEQLHDLQP